MTSLSLEDGEALGLALDLDEVPALGLSLDEEPKLTLRIRVFCGSKFAEMATNELLGREVEGFKVVGFEDVWPSFGNIWHREITMVQL